MNGRVDATGTPRDGWRPGDWVVVTFDDGRPEIATFTGRVWEGIAGSWAAEVVDDEWLPDGRVVYVHAPREDAPRPEPVKDGPSFGDYGTPDPEPTTVRRRIEGTWLVKEVDGCTCNGGTPEANGAHEPGCGLEPELHLSTLPGWPGARDEEAAREKIAAALSEQAVMRFRGHGPDDARGAAFWDAAQGIRESGLGR